MFCIEPRRAHDGVLFTHWFRDRVAYHLKLGQPSDSHGCVVSTAGNEARLYAQAVGDVGVPGTGCGGDADHRVHRDRYGWYYNDGDGRRPVSSAAGSLVEG